MSNVPNQQQHAAVTRALAKRQARQERQIAELCEAVNMLHESRPQTPESEIDAIPGRRGMFNLSQTLSFTATGIQTDMTFSVSVDGPFVLMAYPTVVWVPNAPSGATNLNVPQMILTGIPQPARDTVFYANPDYITLSYSMQDGGSQRNTNTSVYASAVLLSTADSFKPLPKPMLFLTSSIIVFSANILAFSKNASAGTPTTGGQLNVGMPGYRILSVGT